MRPLLLTLTLAVALTAGYVLAQERRLGLKDGPGRAQVEAHCASCHSLDYVLMNSPFPTAAVWDAEVTKMIKAFGAPIDASDAKIIADYLKTNYGS